MFPLFYYMESVVSKVKAITNELFANHENLRDCFLVGIESKDRKVEVFIDSDGPVSYDKFKLISRAIEEYLDESLVLGEKYTLDVSSPGANKPLVDFRQYPKHLGRKIKVVLVDGTEIEGTFKEMEGSQITVVKKIKKETTEHRIDFKEIDKSYIVLAF